MTPEQSAAQDVAPCVGGTAEIKRAGLGRPTARHYRRSNGGGLLYLVRVQMQRAKLLPLLALPAPEPMPPAAPRRRRTPRALRGPPTDRDGKTPDTAKRGP